MESSPAYCTTRNLFAARYLADRLPETDAWTAVDETDLRAAYDGSTELVDRAERIASAGAPSRSEATLIRPVFRLLGIPFAAEERAPGRRRPDYTFFEDAATAATALERREAGDDRDWAGKAVAVADGRPWGRPLDSRCHGEYERGFENPGYRIHAALQELPVRWGVLTNGRTWRLYYAPTSHRLDSYYEIDLPRLLETGDIEDFKHFYCFFRHEAFLADDGGECFLDEVYAESTAFERDSGAAVQENAREAIEVLAEGFRRHPANDIDESDLELLFDGSLVYLYRLLFLFAAERQRRCDRADGCDGLSERLHALKREVAATLDAPDGAYRERRTTLQSRLDDLFERIGDEDRRCGCSGSGHAPAAPGWLFDTAPDERRRRESRFLAAHAIGDASLARALDLIARRADPADDGSAKSFVDYGSVDGHRLESLYEELLECTLAVAEKPLALEDGTRVGAGDADDGAVAPGEVYLTTDDGERKATGSYYTPEYVVEYIVETTLEPLLDEIRTELLTRDAEEGFADAFAERVFELDVLDPAMGSGRFLARVVDYLALAIVDARAAQAPRGGLETVADDRGREIDWARRHVAKRCLYGVDCDPFAVELARLSLWLRTRSAGRAPPTLDERLKTGNAVVGSDIEAIDELAAASDSRTRRQHDRRLEAIANVHTAREFGLDGIPGDAVERMAAALADDDAWARLARSRWFRDAQAVASDEQYFHWPLEFPDVFDEDGTGSDTAGFDAVVGNPPWVATAGRADISATIEAELRSYLADAFEATEGQFDLAVALYEQAVRRSRDGRVGIVVPDSILTREENEPIRAFLLENTSLSRLVRVGAAFSGVQAGAVVCISGDGDGRIRCADAAERTTLTSLSYETIPERVFEARDAKRFLIHLDDDVRAILETIERQPPLETYASVSRGEEIGKRAGCLSSSRSSDARPITPGSAVCRYGLEDDELRYIRSADVEKDEAYYRSPKLIFRQTGDSLVGTYDPADRVTIKSAYNVHAASGSSDELKHLLGVLNSPLLNFYHHYTHAAYRSVFPQLNQSTLETVPVAMADGPDSTLVDAVDERLALTAERSRISPDVLDSLGRYEDGVTMGRLADCRPVDGIETTKLAATTEVWPDLQIGTVDVTSEDSSLVLSASLRYKPDDDRLETDRWGYAETDPMPALELRRLDDDRRDLVDAFVPAAVEKGRGFAGFRRAAAKTISPLERLESITLPRLEDVAEDIREFTHERDHAADLDERIAALDRRIADRVFDLYGLAEDGRERIRREFGGN